ncbi:MAG: hypothetical protein GX803_00400 [Lentisphaerae bacterium]|jgi:hypothetical protein|nr:hypothetical protein [Lentisphaerota bacterium]
MRPRLPRPKRLLTLTLLAAAIGAGIWWLGFMPYDPMAVYRPVPASAVLVGRHLALPDRWGELLQNPLALSLLRTAGVDPDEAWALVADEESREWFGKLAGREGVVAYLPSRFGGPGAWMAVSFLGGQSQKLRWQLSLFRVPGYERMHQFPNRAVWRVSGMDLPPGQHLVIAFGEGVLMACLSENPYAIAEVLGAYDGTVNRLVAVENSFQDFAQNDERSVADRFWLKNEFGDTHHAGGGISVELPVARADALSLQARSSDFERVPELPGGGADLAGLSARLGSAPCAVFQCHRDALTQALTLPGLLPDASFALQRLLEVSGESVLAVFLDGRLSGRLSWGVQRTLRLAGLRVPTLLLATPVADADEAAAAIQRILDLSNARYRGAFITRPVNSGGQVVRVLESATGNEWVDGLAPGERPAYAIVDGWLLACSNRDALQKLLDMEPEDDPPVWAARGEHPAALTGWVDLERGGKVVRDAMGTWSMMQLFFGGGGAAQVREQINEVKAWVDALAPLGEGWVSLRRANNETMLEVDLGLSVRERPARIPEP